MIKQWIGDLMSLIVGNNDEDYEPTRNDYFYFGLMVACIALFVTISLLS